MSRIYFEGTDSQGHDELYISQPNGSDVSEVNLTGAASDGAVTNNGLLGNQTDAIGPVALSFDGQIYMRAIDNQGAEGLFVYQESLAGQPGGKELVGTVGSGPDSNSHGIDPADFVDYHHKVYFNGEDKNGNPGLWVTDGKTAGTRELTGTPSNPDYMSVYKGDLYMNAGGALWSYSSTADVHNGTQSAAAFSKITGNGFDPTDMTASTAGTYTYDPATGRNNLTRHPPEDLFMNGVEKNGKHGLFVYDGSGSPKKIYTGSASSGIDPRDMQEFPGVNGAVFTSGSQKGDIFQENGILFSGVDNSNGDRGLWLSDGTSHGTKEILKSSAFGASSDFLGLNPSDITVDGPVVFFTANDGGPGRGLFAYVPSEQIGARTAPIEILKSSQYDLTDNFNNTNSVDLGNTNPRTMSGVNGNLYFGAAAALPSGGFGTPQLYELTTTNSGHYTAKLVASSSWGAGLGPTSVGATDPHA